MSIYIETLKEMLAQEELNVRELNGPTGNADALREAIEDAERIDFIERKAQESFTGVAFDSHKDHEAQSPRQWRMMWHHTLHDFMPSVRKAIDNARKREHV